MLERKIRKCIGIVTIILLLGISTSPLLTINVCANDPVEKLDQQQALHKQGTGIGPGDILVQSFKPTLMTLTRVELLCSKYHDNIDGELKVSIRRTLYGKELTSITIPATLIPSPSEWVEFDFPNITVVPEETYYIFFTPILDNFSWWYYHDVYDRGSYYFYVPDTWFLMEHLDFSFKTYGYGTPGNEPPNKPGKPFGNNILKLGDSYYFESSFSDPDGNFMEIFFDWGDGTDTGWTGPIPNGTFHREHAWSSSGKYQIRTKARDLPYQDISEWSEPFEILIDGKPPDIDIIKPERAIYFMNFRIIRFLGNLIKNPLVFGRINIEVDARDYGSGVDYVEFYINNRCRSEDHEEPFSWTWKIEPKLINKYTIKAIAYDKVGHSAIDEIEVWKFF